MGRRVSDAVQKEQNENMVCEIFGERELGTASMVYRKKHWLKQYAEKNAVTSGSVGDQNCEAWREKFL
jgi:hypothetical protein